jgi:hypothetical protein
LALEVRQNSPVVSPSIIVEDRVEGGARLKVDGRPVGWGRDFRYGVIRKLESTDLVISMQKEVSTAVKIALVSEGR